MKEIDDGGPAFPIPYASDMDGYVYAPHATGMTLRDYAYISFISAMLTTVNRPVVLPSDREAIRRIAWEEADAMLYERTKHEKEPGDDG